MVAFYVDVQKHKPWSFNFVTTWVGERNAKKGKFSRIIHELLISKQFKVVNLDKLSSRMGVGVVGEKMKAASLCSFRFYKTFYHFYDSFCHF